MQAPDLPDAPPPSRGQTDAPLVRWSRRVAVYAAGTVVVLAGIVILPLPGPMGTPVILLGLTLLARESPLAARLRARLIRTLRLKEIAQARPRRLHVSTLLALAVAATALLAANFVPREAGAPAALAGMEPRAEEKPQGPARGWPLVAHRESPRVPPEHAASGVLDAGWDGASAAANLAVALGILAATALVFEWSARRRAAVKTS